VFTFSAIPFFWHKCGSEFQVSMHRNGTFDSPMQIFTLAEHAWSFNPETEIISYEFLTSYN